MNKEDRKGQSWLVWNSANIISISRFLSIFTLLFLTNLQVEIKLLFYVPLEFTDGIDGWVAKKVRNTEGIGKLIDAGVDKLDKFLIIVFLIQEKVLEMWMIVAIFSGEALALSVAIFGMGIVVKHQIALSGRNPKSWEEVLDIGKKSAAEVLKKWKISGVARFALILYAGVVVGIFAHRMWPNTTVEMIYLGIFFVGLAARAFSIGIYCFKMYAGYREMFGKNGVA